MGLTMKIGHEFQMIDGSTRAALNTDNSLIFSQFETTFGTAISTLVLAFFVILEKCTADHQ